MIPDDTRVVFFADQESLISPWNTSRASAVLGKAYIGYSYLPEGLNSKTSKSVSSLSSTTASKPEYERNN